MWMWNQNSVESQFSDKGSWTQEPSFDHLGSRDCGSMEHKPHSGGMPYSEAELNGPSYWSSKEPYPSGHVSAHAARVRDHQSFQASLEPSRQGQEGSASSPQVSYYNDSRSFDSPRSCASGNTRKECSSANFSETCCRSSSGYPNYQRRLRSEEVFDGCELPQGNKCRRISYTEPDEQWQSPAPQFSTSNTLYMRRPRHTKVDPPARSTDKPVTRYLPPHINPFSRQPKCVPGGPRTTPYLVKPYFGEASSSDEGFLGGQSSNSSLNDKDAAGARFLEGWCSSEEPQGGGLVESYSVPYAEGFGSSSELMLEKRKNITTWKREERMQKAKAEEAIAADGCRNPKSNAPRIFTHRTPQLGRSLKSFAESQLLKLSLRRFAESHLMKLKDLLLSRQISAANVRDEFGWKENNEELATAKPKAKFMFKFKTNPKGSSGCQSETSREKLSSSREPSPQGQEGSASSEQISYCFDSRKPESPRSIDSENVREIRSSTNFPETCPGDSSGYPNDQGRSSDEEFFDENESPHGNKYRRIPETEPGQSWQSPVPQSGTSNVLYMQRLPHTEVNHSLVGSTDSDFDRNINTFPYELTCTAATPHTATYIADPYIGGGSYCSEDLQYEQTSHTESHEAETEEISQQSNHPLEGWRPCEATEGGGVPGGDDEYVLYTDGFGSFELMLERKSNPRKRWREKRRQKELMAEQAIASGNYPDVDPNAPRILSHRTPKLIQVLMRYAEHCDLVKLEITLSRKQIGNANVRDEFGWTAVMFAAKGGHTPALDILKQFGADVSLTELGGNQLTALEIAVACNRLAFIEYLTELPRDVLTVLLKEPRAIALRKDKWKPDAVLPPWSKSARQYFGNLIGPVREGEDEVKFDLSAVTAPEDEDDVKFDLSAVTAREGEDEVKFDLRAVSAPECDDDVKFDLSSITVGASPEINWNEAGKLQAKKLRGIRARRVRRELKLARRRERRAQRKAQGSAFVGQYVLL